MTLVFLPGYFCVIIFWYSLSSTVDDGDIVVPYTPKMILAPCSIVHLKENTHPFV